MSEIKINHLASRLKHLMRLHNNISVAQLARATKLPQPTVHRLIAGHTEDPRLSTLKILVSYFNVTLDYLADNSLVFPRAKSNLIQSDTIKLIPIIDWHNLVFFVHDNEKFLEANNKTDWIGTELPLKKHAFALYSQPCWKQHFEIGTLLLVNPASSLRDGNLILIRFIKENEFALRKITIDGNSKILESINIAKGTEIFNNHHHQVIGVVVQSKYTFPDTSDNLS